MNSLASSVTARAMDARSAGLFCHSLASPTKTCSDSGYVSPRSARKAQCLAAPICGSSRPSAIVLTTGVTLAYNSEFWRMATAMRCPDVGTLSHRETLAGPDARTNASRTNPRSTGKPAKPQRSSGWLRGDDVGNARLVVATVAHAYFFQPRQPCQRRQIPIDNPRRPPRMESLEFP